MGYFQQKTYEYSYKGSSQYCSYPDRKGADISDGLPVIRETERKPISIKFTSQFITGEVSHVQRDRGEEKVKRRKKVRMVNCEAMRKIINAREKPDRTAWEKGKY